MGGTDLDAVLRNLGVTTIVGIGVSVNIGMIDFAFDAVNAGYQFVMPRDAVAGVPEDYADAVLDNTLSLVATLPSTDDVLAAWSGRRAESSASAGALDGAPSTPTTNQTPLKPWPVVSPGSCVGGERVEGLAVDGDLLGAVGPGDDREVASRSQAVGRR